MIDAINQVANLLHPPASRLRTTPKKNAEMAGCVGWGEEVLVTNGRARGVFTSRGVSPSRPGLRRLFPWLQGTASKVPFFLFRFFSMLMWRCLREQKNLFTCYLLTKLFTKSDRLMRSFGISTSPKKSDIYMSIIRLVNHRQAVLRSNWDTLLSFVTFDLTFEVVRWFIQN